METHFIAPCQPTSQHNGTTGGSRWTNQRQAPFQEPSVIQTTGVLWSPLLSRAGVGGRWTGLQVRIDTFDQTSREEEEGPGPGKTNEGGPSHAPPADRPVRAAGSGQSSRLAEFITTWNAALYSALGGS